MAKRKLNLAVLISGRGSNLQALIDATKDPDFPAQIAVVISNVPDAKGLDKAGSHGIASVVINHHKFETRQDFENALSDSLTNYPVDLICLAGFMRILGSDFIRRWPEKIINIHPSLLPAYKGLNTHERVLQDGQKETGCTVHYVTPELDSGAPIIQKRVSVYPDDTPESLAARVLEQEHEAYPEAIRIWAEKHGEAQS